jgi:hypothetical protein
MNEHKEQNLVIYRLVKELWGYFPKGRQKSFKLVLLLTIFSSFMELVSVGSFLPFLEVLVDPTSSKVLGYVKEKLGNSFLDTMDPLLSFTILFIVIIFFSGSQRISKYDFARAVAKFYNLKIDLIKPISIDKIEMKARRPKDMSLSSAKIAFELNEKMPDILYSLKSFSSEK